MELIDEIGDKIVHHERELNVKLKFFYSLIFFFLKKIKE